MLGKLDIEINQLKLTIHQIEDDLAVLADAKQFKQWLARVRREQRAAANVRLSV